MTYPTPAPCASGHDLRGFLEVVRRKRARDIIVVDREVDPKYETTAILTKLEQSYRSPIIVYHRVAGASFPSVTNVCGSTARIALSLGCSVRELPTVYANGCAKPVAPELVSGAPVQQVLLTGGRIDLRRFPRFVYHEGDSLNAYISAAIVVARDPETGIRNLSYHRLMILDRDSTSIFIARGKHLDMIYRKYERAGEAMPIAAIIGVHPACSIGALYTGGADTEEYGIIGGLQRSPLRLVKCATQPLEVPADAEFVLEGFVPPHSRTEEGPFGEFTGYATGSTLSPRFKLTAITSRDNPIFQDIVSGHSEHLLLPMLAIEQHLLESARAVVPGTVAVRVLVPLTAFVSIDKSHDSQPRELIRTLCAADTYVKQVVVVDSSIDVSDLRQVASAVALHVSADRDVSICTGPVTELDPASGNGHGAKLGLDATIPLAKRNSIVKNSVPQQLLDSIDLSQLLSRPRHEEADSPADRQ